MTPQILARVMDETWPAAATFRRGPFLIRDGQGGGKRVSAASAEADWQPGDVAGAEAAMRDLGQAPLFLIRDGDQALDADLAARGYGIVDPVVAYAVPVAGLAVPPPALTAIPNWPPLAVVADLWAAGGIGPARLAVMDRVAGAKTTLLGRLEDRCAGAAFVALSGDTAMLHALEVAPGFRRQGVARHLLAQAACWAQEQGATALSLVVTQANASARALYQSAGMETAGAYHYRQLPVGSGAVQAGA